MPPGAALVTRIAALALGAGAALLGCTSTCTDVPAQTRTFLLARDAGKGAGARPLDECRALCGQSNSPAPSQPRVTGCRVTYSDAGDTLASCDETAYPLCAPAAL
jgi:hypothetical protein